MDAEHGDITVKGADKVNGGKSRGQEKQDVPQALTRVSPRKRAPVASSAAAPATSTSHRPSVKPHVSVPPHPHKFDSSKSGALPPDSAAAALVASAPVTATVVAAPTSRVPAAAAPSTTSNPAITPTPPPLAPSPAPGTTVKRGKRQIPTMSVIQKKPRPQPKKKSKAANATPGDVESTPTAPSLPDATGPETASSTAGPAAAATSTIDPPAIPPPVVSPHAAPPATTPTPKTKSKAANGMQIGVEPTPAPGPADAPGPKTASPTAGPATAATPTIDPPPIPLPVASPHAPAPVPTPTEPTSAITVAGAKPNPKQKSMAPNAKKVNKVEAPVVKFADLAKSSEGEESDDDVPPQGPRKRRRHGDSATGEDEDDDVGLDYERIATSSRVNVEAHKALQARLTRDEKPKPKKKMRRAPRGTGELHPEPCANCENKDLRCEVEVGGGACVICFRRKIKCKYSIIVKTESGHRRVSKTLRSAGEDVGHSGRKGKARAVQWMEVSSGEEEHDAPPPERNSSTDATKGKGKDGLHVPPDIDNAMEEDLPRPPLAKRTVPTKRATMPTAPQRATATTDRPKSPEVAIVPTIPRALEKEISPLTLLESMHWQSLWETAGK